MTDTIIYKNGIPCYPIGDKRYPRCTTVLEIFYRKMYGTPDAKMLAYMSARASIGTAVHKMISLQVHGKPLQPEHKSYLEGEPYRYYMQAQPTIAEWKDNDLILFEDVRVHSHKYQFAGTVDLIIKGENGTARVVDFKTAKRSKTERELTGYFLQIAAYSVAARETLGLKISGGDILFLLEKKSKLISIESDELLNNAKHFVRLRNEFYRQHGI